jgi:hypothetical protein
MNPVLYARGGGCVVMVLLLSFPLPLLGLSWALWRLPFLSLCAGRLGSSLYS